MPYRVICGSGIWSPACMEQMCSPWAAVEAPQCPTMCHTSLQCSCCCHCSREAPNAIRRMQQQIMHRHSKQQYLLQSRRRKRSSSHCHCHQALSPKPLANRGNKKYRNRNRLKLHQAACLGLARSTLYMANGSLGPCRYGRSSSLDLCCCAIIYKLCSCIDVQSSPTDEHAAVHNAYDHEYSHQQPPASTHLPSKATCCN